MGFKKIPDRYTPFFDSLGDKEARESHKRDEQDYFNPINNSFQAVNDFVGVVMTPMATQAHPTTAVAASNKKVESYLLVQGLTDAVLAEPCEIEALGVDEREKAKLYNYVLTCYPKATSKSLVSDQTNLSLQPGDKVNCNFSQGPAFLGRQRGLTFDGTRTSRNPGFANKPCVGQGITGVGGTAGAGGQLGNYLGGVGASAETGEPNTPMTSTDSSFAKPSVHAKSFGKGRRGTIKYIMLHSTDGSLGPANKTLERFGRGPTISFSWKHPTTGKTIKNPLLSEYMKFNTKLPEKGVVRERYGYESAGKPKRKAKHIEKKVSTSIHYAVDGLADGNIWQGLAEKDTGYHAPGYNHTSIGIEMCGRPNKKRGQGATPKFSGMYNDIMLNNCAKLVADICKRHNLPPTRETIRGHEDGQKSNRTDPGESRDNFDYTNFLARVVNYRNQMG